MVCFLCFFTEILMVCRGEQLAEGIFKNMDRGVDIILIILGMFVIQYGTVHFRAF